MVINDKSLMQDCLVELGHHTRAKEADRGSQVGSVLSVPPNRQDVNNFVTILSNIILDCMNSEMPLLNGNDW